MTNRARGKFDAPPPTPSSVNQMRRVFVSLALITLATPVFGQVKPQQELKEAKPEKVDTVVYSRLKYRYIGPEGNRVKIGRAHV